jgi:hypothetical protein
VSEQVADLFAEYADAYARGEHPRAEEYLARAGGQADELARLLERFVRAAPASEPDAATLALTEAALTGEPPLLVLRTRRGLRRDEVVDALMSALALDPTKREKVKSYYHQLEGGLLEPARVNRRIFEVLAKTLQASLADVSRWRLRSIEAATAYRVDALAAAQAPPRRAFAQKREEPDEIDELFLGGADRT